MSINSKAQRIEADKCFARIQNFQPIEGYCNMTWDETLCWDATPINTVAHQRCPQFVLGLSKTGVVTRVCGDDGVWFSPNDTNTTAGWSNYTDCFKPDPLLASVTHHIDRIKTMKNIGYGISLVSLSVAVFIMLVSRRLHCKSNSLHINLFIAFILRASLSFMKELLFVNGLGLEKDVSREDGEVIFIHDGMHWECKLLVSLFMYAFSASLMWIFMEGLYLHMLVYKTLFTERSGIRMYVIIGWDILFQFCLILSHDRIGQERNELFQTVEVSPFLYVIPWILTRIYKDNSLCWNTDEFGLKWIIKVPVLITIIINFIFFINIVRVLCDRMKFHRNSSGNQQLRKLAKFSLVLIPLFGVLYIVFAAYPHGLNIHADIMYLYCEMFYNSFQGLVLAILFCFLNEEVHNEIRRCWFRHRRTDNGFSRTLTMTMYRKGSNLSHTSASTHIYRDNTAKYNGCRKFKDKNENPLLNKKNRAIGKHVKLSPEHCHKNSNNAMEEHEQMNPLME